MIPATTAPRPIRGMAAVLLPYGDDGDIDWPAFEAHVIRTSAAGLTVAVNMDTGYVQLLGDTGIRRVLEVAADLPVDRVSSMTIRIRCHFCRQMTSGRVPSLVLGRFAAQKPDRVGHWLSPPSKRRRAHPGDLGSFRLFQFSSLVVRSNGGIDGNGIDLAGGASGRPRSRLRSGSCRARSKRRPRAPAGTPAPPRGS